MHRYKGHFLWPLFIWHIIYILVNTLIFMYLAGNKQGKEVKIVGKDKKRFKAMINSEQQKIMEFTSGKYKDVNFKWDVVKTADNKITIKNLRPVCDCGGKLIPKTNVKIGNFVHLTPVPYCVNCEKPLAVNFNEDFLYEANAYFSNILSKKIENYNNLIKNA